MPNDEVKISQLPVGTLGNGSLFETSEVSGEGYASTKVAASDLGNYVNTVLQYAGLKTAVLNVVGAVNSVLAIFADEYNTTTYYNPGWYCIKDGVLYVCQNDTHGTWSEGAWTETTVDEALRSMKSEIEYFDLIKFNSDNVAAFHSTTTAYSKGDYCINDEDLVLYRAKVDIPVGTAWDDTKWEVCTIGGELKSLNDSRLDDLPVVTMPYSAVATFNTDRAVPLADVSCQIVAQQSGSGDPSPSNIRSISGFSSLNLTATGKNLFDKTQTLEEGNITDDGSIGSATGYVHTDYIKVNASTDYVTSGDVALGNTRNAIACYDKDKNFLTRLLPSSAGGWTFTTTSATAFIRMNLGGSSRDLNTIQLEEGTTATTYQAFGKNVTIPLGSTVYGGTIDVTTGLLTIDKVYYTVDDFTWTYAPAYGRMQATLPFNPSATTINARNLPFLCSQYRCISDGRPYGDIVNNDCYYGGTSNNNLFIHDDRYSNADTFKTNEGSTQFVFPIAEPTTVQLSATTLTALSGENNIWADTGDTSVAYRESAQKYIDENTGLSRAKVYSLNLSQGGAWINTGVDMTSVDTLMFERNDNSDVNLQVVIKKSQIAVYTGGADVYTTIYAQGGKPLNVRIYNNILYASYNGTGAATYVTNVYALKDVF